MNSPTRIEAPTPAIRVGSDPADRVRWVRRARFLAWFTIGYNLLEGAAGIGFGIADGSLALLGFGIDSCVEMASASFVLWRLGADLSGQQRQAQRERRAGMAVAGLLILLGAGTLIGSGWLLWTRQHPESTLIGGIIAAVSLSFMFWLWRSKLAAAHALASHTLRQDAACARGCLTLSFTLLIGSVAYTLAPALWWIDSAAAIVIAALIVREGLDGFRTCLNGGSSGCGCEPD
jgi:divalent metal cation (Fe/Co/Zn/Cd) transporter